MQLQLFAIVDAALDGREMHAQADEILRRAVVQLARELAARAFLGQRDLRGQRAQLRVVLRERGLGFAHRGHIAAAAPEAQHVPILDDADHRNEQHAIEAVRSVHDVLDVAHLVAIANRIADAFDIDPATRSGDRRDACRPPALCASLTPSATMNAVLHSATIAVFAHPGDLIVG